MDIVHIVELLCIERGRDMSPLWLSLWVASIALIIVIVSGLAACYWMNRCKWSGMAIIDALITLPLVLPPVVVGFALLMVLTPGYAFGAWDERCVCRIWGGGGIFSYCVSIILSDGAFCITICRS